MHALRPPRAPSFLSTYRHATTAAPRPTGPAAATESHWTATTQDTAAVTADVLNAIQYLHDVGITHRDLKVPPQPRPRAVRCARRCAGCAARWKPMRTACPFFWSGRRASFSSAARGAAHCCEQRHASGRAAHPRRVPT